MASPSSQAARATAPSRRRAARRGRSGARRRWRRPFLQREPARARRRPSHRAAPPLRRRRALRGRRASTTASPAASSASSRGATSWRRRTASRSSSIPHHDHLTGVEFQVSAAGVQRDAVTLRRQLRGRRLGRGLGVGGDASTREGWTVEMRIPFSQLRFPAAARPHLGRQRAAHRAPQERGLLARPRAEERERAGLAHGPPRGHRAASPPAGTSSCCPTPRRARSTSRPRAPGNPFNDGSRTFGGAGLDLKYGAHHAT